MLISSSFNFCTSCNNDHETL